MYVINIYLKKISLCRSPWPEELPNPSRSSAGKLSAHPKSISQSNIAVNPLPKTAPITRSQSQDINLSVVDSTSREPKVSLSDTCLDSARVKPTPIRPMTIKEQPSVSIEDDICSTDSSVLDENDLKKKKRKLFNFTKKSKNKGDWLQAMLRVGRVVNIYLFNHVRKHVFFVIVSLRKAINFLMDLYRNDKLFTFVWIYNFSVEEFYNLNLCCLNNFL